MITFSKEEFESWKDFEETRAVFKHFKEMRESARNSMVDAAISNDMEMVAMNNTRVAGIIMGINMLLEMDYEDLTDG